MITRGETTLATIALAIPTIVAVAHARPHEEVYSLRHFGPQRAAAVVGVDAVANTIKLEQCDLLSGEDPNSNNKFAINHEPKHCESRAIKVSSAILAKYANAPTAVADQLKIESQQVQG